MRYAPDGTEERRIHFPAVRVSSVIFGGPDYTDITVTTAGGQDKAQFGPGAGALYRVRLGIRGVPEFTSRVTLQRVRPPSLQLVWRPIPRCDSRGDGSLSFTVKRPQRVSSAGGRRRAQLLTRRQGFELPWGHTCRHLR